MAAHRSNPPVPLPLTLAGDRVPPRQRVQGVRDSPHRRTVGFAASQYALRKRCEKTVMTARNSRRDSQQNDSNSLPELPSPAAEEITLPVKDRDTLNHLFSATYEELRRLASSVRRGDPSATL